MVDAADRGHTVRSFDEELEQLSGMIAQMGGIAEKQVSDAIRALMSRDLEIAAQVIERDDQVDRFEEEIDQFVIRLLAIRQPVAVDLRVVAMALKISNDLERISDYSVSIAKRAQRLADQRDLKPMLRIPRIAEICIDMVKTVLDAYAERNAQQAMTVWERDVYVDELYTSLFRELITYMLEDPRTISQAIDLMFVAKNLERIGDHATNIAEKIHYMIHGEEINRPRS